MPAGGTFLGQHLLQTEGGESTGVTKTTRAPSPGPVSAALWFGNKSLQLFGAPSHLRLELEAEKILPPIPVVFLTPALLGFNVQP